MRKCTQCYIMGLCTSKLVSMPLNYYDLLSIKRKLGQQVKGLHVFMGKTDLLMLVLILWVRKRFSVSTYIIMTFSGPVRCKW